MELYFELRDNAMLPSRRKRFVGLLTKCAEVMDCLDEQARARGHQLLDEWDVDPQVLDQR
jgi:hypothetical protein